MQERKITAICTKPFRKKIQVFSDRNDFFSEHGYQKDEHCLARKRVGGETPLYIISIKWHEFVLPETEFLNHFEVYYEEGCLNACVKKGMPCQNLRSYMGFPCQTNDKKDHWCQRSQDVGRGVCSLYETTVEEE